MKSFATHLSWCAALVLAAAMATAAHAADTKIGFIDTDRILRESAPAERALAKLKKEFAPREQDLQRLQQQAKTLQDQVEKNGLTLSDSDRAAKEQELSRLSLEFQRKQRDLQVDEGQRQNEELAALREHAGKAIRQIAESGKYDLILSDAVYRSPSVDITDLVLKALAAEK